MRRPLCLLCLVFACFLFLWMEWPGNADEQRPLEAGQQIRVAGRVAKKEYGSYGGILYLTDISSREANVLVDSNTAQDPVQDFTQQLQFDQDKNQTQGSRTITGAVCYCDFGVLPKIGQWVVINGKVATLKQATNPGEFDQRKYYYLQGIQLQLKESKIERIAGSGNWYEEGLFLLKNRAEQLLQEAFDEKNASIMAAMILGSKKGMDQEVRSLYQASGIAHILAISGLHISFLGMALYRLLLRTGCTKRLASVLCIGIMYSYGVLTGMSASGKRAICMFVVQLLAVWAKRTYDMLSALALAGILLLAEQPLYLYQSGFLLSFGAILGLALITPLCEQWLLYGLATAGRLRERIRTGEKRRKKQEQKAYKESAGQAVWKEHGGTGEAGGRLVRTAVNGMAASIGVTIATLPVLVQSFYELPLYSALLNLLILPLMAVLLPAGLFTVCLQGLFPFLARIPVFLCQGILLLYELLCKVCLLLPGSSWRLGHAKVWQVVVYYVLLMGCLLWQKRSKGKKAGAGLLLLAAAVVLLTWRSPEAPLQIHMVDVGQGDCFLIQAEGKNLLIDGGSSSQKNVGTYQLLPVCRYYGISELEYVFITHLDQDHYSAIMELLGHEERGGEQLRIRNLILPKGAAGSGGKQEAYDRLVSSAGQRGIKVYTMKAGDTVWCAGLRISCLHPLAQEEAEDSNETSLVLDLAYGAFRGLFMGDLGSGHEDEVIGQLKEGGYTLLKAGHHGSRYSTTKELLEAAAPRLVLLSYGRKNSYGHPHQETLYRIREGKAAILETARHGAVTVSTDGKVVWTARFFDNIQP